MMKRRGLHEALTESSGNRSIQTTSNPIDVDTQQSSDPAHDTTAQTYATDGTLSVIETRITDLHLKVKTHQRDFLMLKSLQSELGHHMPGRSRCDSLKAQIRRL